MPAYDNNKNPMPEKICIKNKDCSTSSVSYETYTRFYEAMCKKEFMSQCKSIMRIYAGNHMFKIKVPDNMVYGEEYYTIRGAQNAVKFMHVIALASNKLISLQDKDLNILVSVEIDTQKGYKIHFDKNIIKRLEGFGPDNEVIECLSFNGSIWELLNKYSAENYYNGKWMVCGKCYSNQAVSFCYVLKDAIKISLETTNNNVFIYDENENAICYIKGLNNETLSIFTPSGKEIGTYDLKWLGELQTSSKKEIIKKITTNIEYICDKLLDNKYDKVEAAVHISKLSQNIRSFM